MNDREILDSVNSLCRVAIKYRDEQKLRSHIYKCVYKIIARCKPNMKKVHDLKIGDRIKILATDYHREPFKHNFAKIIDIVFEDFGNIHTINFEGDLKDHTTTLQLQCYQTEFEVVGECKRFIPKGSPNKKTLTKGD